MSKLKKCIFLILFFISNFLYGQNPLSLYDSEWDKKIYEECNTAENVSYLDKNEKDLIWVINCFRRYPDLFYKTIVVKWDNPKRYKPIDRNGFYYKSLIDFIKIMKPVNILYPDSLVFISSYYHSLESVNYFGHKRVTDKSILSKCNCGEAISYNSFNSVDIVMDLLIDNGNPEFLHRKVLSYNNFNKIGCSIIKHNIAFYLSVINFK